ncbi:MAG: bifunctional diaminohydroxyphosphoribosylaminopyrimidine deaminase/5-amino-6-(5-phosphoribosylamino)uracil reductase RibD [bacterium]|nr:bifunctional diaminohydroxyphosphoribosylaminopyrimidine deaminase/5-amino-6-(5-phosphoribosylamino)uracil reductase RibD [bacterium]
MNDKYYLKKCFSLARKAQGSVSPNPLVGAVLVKNGKVIGKGWHKKYGIAHAEVNAIQNATEDIAGSTLYCNLEPCCHTNKQTPPCVPLVINKKIKKVVISNLDPNKNVNGKGIKQLQDAGIEVITGIAEDEGKDLNKFYFKYVSENIPYITLKIAQSIDGKISESKNKQTWLTGKESIKYVHKLRGEYDAVLVGANTIKVDNPLLTLREIKGRNPVRVVIDGKLSIPVKSKIFNSSDPEKTWIFTSSTSSSKKIFQLEQLGAKVFKIRSSANKEIRLIQVLKSLAENKITSLLVEGGQKIFTQFLDQNLFDEIVILQSPKILSRGINAFESGKSKALETKEISKLGNDIRIVFGRKFAD